jgi:DNA repair exonuclease SbcCD ATPase subunit
MSMLTGMRKQDNGANKLPRASTVPAVAPARAPRHEDYADEAKRAAQRYLDQVEQIDGLVGEVEQWRNRALLAEGEIKRLLERERDLQATIDRKVEEFAAERDQTRQTIAVLTASYTNASKIILDGFATLEKLEGVKARIDVPRIDVPQIAAAMTPAPDPYDATEPMPSVVTKGPAYGDEGGNVDHQSK